MNGKVNDTENMKPRKKVECACEEFDIGLGILHLILKFFETFLKEPNCYHYLNKIKKF